MLRNYLRIAFRHFWRHRAFSFLNIIGLTIGLTACFLVFLYVHFELSYDGFHTKADRIYQLVCDVKTPTSIIHQGLCSAPMAINAAEEFPEIEKVVRVDEQRRLVRNGALAFEEDKSVLADSTFFEVFDFPLLQGDPRTALREPLSIVLSATTAKKYFGNGNPMGRTLLLKEEGLTARVTGIMKDMPENTELKADLLVSKSTSRLLNPNEDRDWSNFGLWSYVLLKPGANAAALEKKFPAFLEKRDGLDMKKNQLFFSLFLRPLRDMYLPAGEWDAPVQGDRTNVYVFSIVGIFILLIAAINFINLTTARSTERGKEVGIRKVMGAERRQLTGQFLGESVLQCLIAFTLAVGVCALLIPQLNSLAGKTICDGLFHHPGYLLYLLGLAVGIGLLSGVYPALLLAAFQPVVVLKGRSATGARGLFLRKGLVVFQFTISIAFIAATSVIHAQLSYLYDHDLGLDNKQMLVLDTRGDDHKFPLQQEIGRLPGVVSTSLSSSSPGGGLIYALSELQDPQGKMQTGDLNLYLVDFSYMPQHKMGIVAGRAFSRDYSTDSTTAIILNESAVKKLNYTSPQAAIGRKFRTYGRAGQIIGVVRDFNYFTLKYNTGPLGLLVVPNDANLLSIHVRKANLPATIAAIAGLWKKTIPYRPFSYYFEDEFFNQRYQDEDRFGRLFLHFAVLAILISCLGLLGLASYTTLQRTREVGIRKVLGASVTEIVHLLSKEFLFLVVLALLVATPLCWYFMDLWLNGYHYRIGLHWWYFALAGGVAFFISLFTVGLQTIRAALANPVKCLREEN